MKLFSRGQMETVGLVVIVILIVFIGLFVLIFSHKSGSDDDLFLEMKVNNFVNAIRYVSVGMDSFEDKVASCCSFNECDDVQEVVESGFGYFDRGMSFFIDCYDGKSLEYSGNGGCSSGVSSVKVSLSSGDKFYAIVCRK